MNNRTDRPNRQNRTNRPKRHPMHKPKSIFDLGGNLDFDSYFYYWAVDSAEDGSKIQRMLMAGYEFVKVDELPEGTVGTPQIYQHKQFGSVIAVPANKRGDKQYLMKLDINLRNMDLKERHDNLVEIDRQMQRLDPGQYGKVKIDSGLSPDLP